MSGPFDRKRSPSRPSPSTSISRSEEDDARNSSKHRAALEALFAAKPTSPPSEPPPADRPSKKMVVVPSREDPREPERSKRLAKLLAAEGRTLVTKAADDFVRAGFELPDEQEVMLKLLDHGDDERVKGALEALDRLLREEAPQRKTVLDARLRRLEDDAEDASVRDLAGSIRRSLLARARP
jgi:hypothetical protein